MKRWLIASAGIGLFGAALVATAPASLAQRFLPPELEFDRLDGTLWRGQASNVRWKGQPLFDRLGWDWQLSRLLTLTLALDLDTVWQNVAGHARLRAGFSGYALQDTDLTLPIDPFTADLAQLAEYRLRGNLNLVTRDFVWTDGRGNGEISADWRGARSEWSGDTVMGDYRIGLKAAEKGYAVKVETLSGPLMIQGDGTGAPGQGWNVGAQIQAPADRLPQFQILLSRFGPPTPEGRYFLRYSFK